MCFLDGLFRNRYYGFFSSYCTPELRTSGRTLTLFIFIDTVSVCEERKMERNEKIK